MGARAQRFMINQYSFKPSQLFNIYKMLKNRTWGRPQDWDRLGIDEKEKWNEISDNIEHFYRDMKSHKHITTGLNEHWMTDNEKQSFTYFMNTMEDQDKIYKAGNMLSKISIGQQSQELLKLSKGMLYEPDYSYVFLSMFAYILILTYESNLNVIKKTLATSNLKDKREKPWLKSIEETSPEDLFNLLSKYSVKPVEFLKIIIFKNKPLRNAFSHGLFWYENERIFWVLNANSIEAENILFSEFIRIVREQSMFSMCLLWVGGKLIKEGFFNLW